MEKIQDAFCINNVPYSEMRQEQKHLIDKSSEKLKEWERHILDYEKAVLNIITTNPRYTLLIQSEFPDDLTGYMVHAYTQSKS